MTLRLSLQLLLQHCMFSVCMCAVILRFNLPFHILYIANCILDCIALILATGPYALDKIIEDRM